MKTRTSITSRRRIYFGGTQQKDEKFSKPIWCPKRGDLKEKK